MAAPHVAGVVALLWSAVPELIGNIAETESILQGTAQFRSSTQCGSAGPPNSVFGWGIVDALAALQESTPVTLTASPANIPAGATLTAAWSGIASASSPDWIGLYQPGSANAAFIDWICVSCSTTPGSPRTSGSCPFTVPASLTAGTFELRLLANDGFNGLTTSNTFAVTSGQALTLAASSTE
jgi:hypothetical protein